MDIFRTTGIDLPFIESLKILLYDDVQEETNGWEGMWEGKLTGI